MRSEGRDYSFSSRVAVKNAWKTRYTRGKTNLSDILPGQIFSFQKCRQQKDRNSMKYFTNKLGDRITNIRTNSTNNQLIEKNSKPLNRKIFYVSRFIHLSIVSKRVFRPCKRCFRNENTTPPREFFFQDRSFFPTRFHVSCFVSF